MRRSGEDKGAGKAEGHSRAGEKTAESRKYICN